MATREKEVKKLVRKADLTCAHGPVISASNHIKVRTRRADGGERLFVFSLTPSDRRADLNSLAMLRRFARGA
jgi:hypothetical protein